MLWLELLASVEAAGNVVLASLNCLYFLSYLRQARLPARRVGSMALAILNGGLALEALFFLARVQIGEWEPAARFLALVLLRSLLLLSAGVVSALIWRAGGLRRP